MKSFLVLIMCLFCFSVLAVDLTYTFSPEYASKIIEGTCYLDQNRETIPNPEYVPEEIIYEGEYIPNPEYAGEPETLAKYTDAQWTKERIRRYILSFAKRGLAKKRKDELDAIDLPDEAIQ